ncbi:hypothetical protein EGH21_15510 [Halomicroarcula sp. F13]|uniref:Uncharacterized protein n=1 Tax=Haloarcula rubra TaxID=2487747 RepID=A0AAW4PUY6_9EURY|nr:hypothetical protein [Halomicroarcula rubra]MBX0324436.1 hypothetical protein [Halomicroarcula rubra]
MNKIQTQDEKSTTTEKFYMPAVTLPPHLDRIEDVVSDVFDFHGVVLIPDSYNK